MVLIIKSYLYVPSVYLIGCVSAVHGKIVGLYVFEMQVCLASQENMVSVSKN